MDENEIATACVRFPEPFIIASRARIRTTTRINAISCPVHGKPQEVDGKQAPVVDYRPD